jgi:bifunctional DNA-binding transcriptional regulator/antitoxin component of YhaV-PrlF toxin-antitoxin module
MASLTVTLKGQVTLRRDLLQHLGVKPGERIEFDKLPGGELRVKAARPSGSIDTFIGRHAGKVSEPLTIEQMNEVTASGWADSE